MTSERAHTLRSCSILLALFFGVAIHAESFTFTFAPPIDRPIVQTATMSAVTKADGEEKTRVTKERTVLRYRKAEGGYVLSGTTTEASVTVNGEDTTEMFAKLIEGVDVTYEISGSGELKAVRGYDAVMRKLRATMPKDMPAETQALLTKLLSEETMVTRARSEWDGRISGFAGMTVEIGDVYESESEIPLPTGGTLTFYTTTTIAARERCGNAQCLRIVFEYNSDPGGTKDMMDTVMKALPGEGIKTDGMTLTGSGERLIDPSTMNIYRETNERTMRMSVTGPDGKKILVERTEKKEYAFEYPPS